MARQGQVAKGTYTEVTFLRTAADTGGSYLRMAQRIAPGHTAPPEHLHQRQQETFEVKSGRMWVRVAGQERVLQAGESVIVPPNTPHAFRNDADFPLQLYITLTPALNSETFFETIVYLERHNLLPDKRVSWGQLLQMALLIRHYQMPLAGVPHTLQQAVFAVLSALAYRAGYRSFYPEASPYGALSLDGSVV
jgi:quercetin dioxygenase-like cupin family protein